MNGLVLSTLISKATQLAASAGQIVIVGILFNSVERGLYFALTSLLALQMFFELGIGLILIQMVAKTSGRISADGKYIDPGARTSEVVLFTKRIYRKIAFAYVALAIPAGYIYLQASVVSGDASGEVLVVWVLAAIGAGLTLWNTSKLVVIEGLGGGAVTSRTRAMQTIVSVLAFFLVALLDGGIYSVCALSLISGVYLALVDGPCSIYKNINLLETGSAGSIAEPSWKRDVLPLQWKMAVSWVSGYFSLQAVNLISFKKLGVVESGKLGMSMAIFSAILALSMSWVNAKIPEYSRLIANNEKSSALKCFNRAFKGAALLCAFSVVVAISVASGLSYFGLNVKDRLPTSSVLLVLGAACLGNQYVYSISTFMRSHHMEPIYIVSLIVGVCIFTATYIASAISLWYVVLAYFAIVWIISVPAHGYLYNEFLKAYKYK